VLHVLGVEACLRASRRTAINAWKDLALLALASGYAFSQVDSGKGGVAKV
jgi:hypothetical protein